MEIRNQMAIESRSNGIGNFILNNQKLYEGISLLAKACAKKAAKLGYLDEGILLESSTLKGITRSARALLRLKFQEVHTMQEDREARKYLCGYIYEYCDFVNA